MELSVLNLVFEKLIFIYSHIYYLIGVSRIIGINLVSLRSAVICDLLFEIFLIHL